MNTPHSRTEPERSGISSAWLLASAISFIVFYWSLGAMAQVISTDMHWQEWPPIVVFSAVAEFWASAACLYNMRLSEQGRLTRGIWLVLGLSLITQGAYEWLTMRQIVGDEDGLVVVLTLISVLSTYALLKLETLSPVSRNAWVLAVVVQALATVTDASDGGLSLVNGATLGSYGGLADILDLLWTPAYALVMTGIAIELLRRARRIYPANDTPRIWILSNGRLGDLTQMRVLADTIGWPTEIKQVKLKTGLRLDLPALSPFLFDKKNSSALDRPWPDLVITAEAPLAPVARWIQSQSRGLSRTVHIGRPVGPASGHDLVLTTPQYNLPESANVLRLPLPLAPDPHFHLTAAEENIRQKLNSLPKPVTAVLVGGASVPYRFGRADADELRRRLEQLTHRLGGSCIVITSPRTGKDVEDALRLPPSVPGAVYLWGRNKGNLNPYRPALLVADRFVVTSDSISMISEAIAMGKPVHVHELPYEDTIGSLVSMLLAYLQGSNSKWRYLNPVFWMFKLGLVYAPANKVELIRHLRNEGLLEEWPAERAAPQWDTREASRAAVRRLFGTEW